ncbi:MAG TPA: FMN-binding protein [Candidatus Limnocylindrales bacterium]|nr:FMN-binding protein [Candidatus Limnocylindrales bacterium]
MRQRAAAATAALGLALVLLVNFRAPQDAALVGAVQRGGSTAGSGSTTTGSSTGTSTGTAGGSTGGSAATAAPAGAGSTASGTFTGQDIQMPYGDVQVRISVKNGRIVDVTALNLPSGGHSGRISNFVAPILRRQALTAQSANIDGVSGATYTSQAYAASLQAALDAAGM